MSTYLCKGFIIQAGDSTQPDGLEVPQSLQGFHKDLLVIQHDPTQRQVCQGNGECPERLVVWTLTQTDTVRQVQLPHGSTVLCQLVIVREYLGNYLLFCERYLILYNRMLQNHVFLQQTNFLKTQVALLSLSLLKKISFQYM